VMLGTPRRLALHAFFLWHLRVGSPWLETNQELTRHDYCGYVCSWNLASGPFKNRLRLLCISSISWLPAFHDQPQACLKLREANVLELGMQKYHACSALISFADRGKQYMFWRRLVPFYPQVSLLSARFLTKPRTVLVIFIYEIVLLMKTKTHAVWRAWWDDDRRRSSATLVPLYVSLEWPKMTKLSNQTGIA
jgi:hypothetical protein